MSPEKTAYECQQVIDFGRLLRSFVVQNIPGCDEPSAIKLVSRSLDTLLTVARELQEFRP